VGHWFESNQEHPMTKKQALDKTIQKFTNLYDGSVLPEISVSKVIRYYESLLVDKPIAVKSSSAMQRNWINNLISDIEDEQTEDYGGPAL
jgi:hypothetical protein